MNAPGRLYVGEVMHRRLFPVRYRFAYRVFSVLLDIDRLHDLPRASRLLAYNRFGLLSFHDRDHGPRDGSPLRPWIERALRRFGVELEGGRIELLCFPRVLGYVFNPLSIWYCRHADGRLRAVLCEVSNTFGERHSYCLHAGGAPLEWPVRQVRGKCFHVSPFISMQADYHFRFSEPGEDLQVVIREFQDDRLMLAAAQVGRGQPLDTAHLLRAVIAIPLLTLKVMTLIHWQALKIWLKGAPFHRKPTPPAEEIS